MTALILTPREAADYLNGCQASEGHTRKVGVAKIRRLCADGTLGAWQDGRGWQIPRVRIDAWLAGKP